MKDKFLKKLYIEYLSKYHSAGVKRSPDKLRDLIEKEVGKAINNYKRLSLPKICTQKVYIKNWVRESLEKDFATKTLETIHLDKPGDNPYAKALSDYFNLYPLEYIQKFNKKVYDAKPEERLNIWKGLNFPVEKIDENLNKIITARNQYANNKGFSSYLAFALSSFKIPLVAYDKFLKNIDKLIDYCTKQLPETKLPSWFYSEFSSTCFKCQLKLFPFRNYSEIFDFVAIEYPILKKFQSKIIIKEGNKTYMSYQKEKDIFKIVIRGSENFRHRSMFLIHELGHVVSNLNCFKQGFNTLEKGKYFAERDALDYEFNILKKASPRLYQAYFGDILGIFCTTLFELEIYKNPNQDLSKLNAKVYNQCFKEANQEINRSYLIDDSLIMSPFSNLRYAVAHAEYILDLISKKMVH